MILDATLILFRISCPYMTHKIEIPLIPLKITKLSFGPLGGSILNNF